jgi:xylulokinase
MSKKYLVGVDFGTTGTKSIVFDTDGNQMGVGYLETPTIFPKPGYAEIDPNLVTHGTQEATRIAIEKSGVDPKDIIGVSFSNICSSIVPMDADGNYIHPFIPWNDTRCYEIFDYMNECMAKDGTSDAEDYRTTGYTLRCNCTLASMIWVQKNLPEIYEKTYKFINAHSVLAKAYTGTAFVDDQPCITFSKVADVETLEYIPELCDRYGFDFNKLPDVKPTTSLIGTVSSECSKLTGLLEGTPVYVGTGDVMCATIGAGACEDGVACLILGTGGPFNAYCSQLTLHPEAKIPLHGSPIGGWHIFGATSAAASSYTWFADTFCQLEKGFADMNKTSVYTLLNDMAAKSPAGANGLIYAPWLMGADCPNLDSNARGAFIGMSFSHNKNDMIRSVLEGVSFDLRIIREVCEQMMVKPFHLIRLMGGGSKSPFWAQMIADINDVPIETTECDEAAALAAAIYAGVGAGEYPSIQEAAQRVIKVKYRYEPNPDNVEMYNELFAVYKEVFDALAPKVFPGLAAYQSKYHKR